MGKAMQLEQKQITFALEVKEDGAAIEGYASTFGNVDSYGDIVELGAFKKSLKGRIPKMLWQHDMRKLVGVWDTVKEDDKGLFVKGRFADTQLGREARELAKIGALDSMSIGYATVKSEYDDKKNIRTLKEVELYEISLVTFPANEKALITGVKSADQIQTIREFEDFLRDAGFSRKRAKEIASHGFVTAEEVQRDAAMSELKKTLENNAIKLRSIQDGIARN